MSKSTQQELWRLVNPGDSFLPGDQHWSWQHSEWLPVPSLYYAREVQEGAGPVRRRMKSAEARREYDAALPALLKNMRISSAAESALDSVTGPDGANDIESQRTGKISPNQNGDTQRPGVQPGAAAEDAPQWAWRDLQIGERIMPGDRILSSNAMTWNIWTDNKREVIVNTHTFPCQRLVTLPPHE